MLKTDNKSRSSYDWLVFSPRPLEVFERLQAYTIENVPSSVYIYDLVEQRTISASSSLAAMLGYTDEEIHAMGTNGLASIIHPDDLKSVSEHYLRFTTLKSGEVIAIDYRIKRPDGTWCYLRSQETPLVQASDGFPLQVLGIVQDITEVSNSQSRKAA